MSEYQGHFDTAQVCPNGHVTNSCVKHLPVRNSPHCTICGEATVTECSQCSTAIRGAHISWNEYVDDRYKPPNFCHQCGNQHEWTRRRVDNAVQLYLMDSGKDSANADEFRECITAITKDTAGTQASSIKVLAFLSNVGKNTADAIRSILIDVASEAAKKIIWPQP